MIDSNGGRCIPISGHDPYTWAYQTPCKTSVGGRTYTLDTTQLADGEHHIQVIVEDAAGNQSTVLDRTVDTQNATVSSLAALPGPGTSSSASTASILGPGTPNGTGASESARLDLGEPRTISRSFAHRALNLDGRLLNAQGKPIAGAALDVMQRVDGTTTPELIAHASTRSDGTFSVRVSAGPSRLIELGYRAFSDNAGFAADATVEESVRAGVQLNVTLLSTSAEGAITLSGTVQGPIPAQGARNRPSARALPRPVGAVPNTSDQCSRALPGRLPVRGRRRSLSVPGRSPRGADGPPVHPRLQPGD